MAENKLLLQDFLLSWFEAHRCIQGTAQKGDDVDTKRVNCFRRIGQVPWVWPERLVSLCSKLAHTGAYILTFKSLLCNYSKAICAGNGSCHKHSSEPLKTQKLQKFPHIHFWLFYISKDSVVFIVVRLCFICRLDL